MTLFYKSTRDSENVVSASQAILQGLAVDGGLYVPTEIPEIDLDFKHLANQSYQEIAALFMQLFLPDFTQEELYECINMAYDQKFDDKEIAPLVKVGDQYYLELFHGPTLAFKDIALSILPHLMKKKQHRKIIWIKKSLFLPRLRVILENRLWKALLMSKILALSFFLSGKWCQSHTKKSK